MTFSLNPFTVEPEDCGVTYECISIKGALDATPDENTSCSDWNAQLNTLGTMTNSYSKDTDYASVRPQEYTVTIRGTATKSGQTADAEFKFRLKDICDPPASSFVRPTLLN